MRYNAGHSLIDRSMSLVSYTLEQHSFLNWLEREKEMMSSLLKRFNDLSSNRSIGDGHFVSHRVLAILVSAFARDALVITGSK